MQQASKIIFNGARATKEHADENAHDGPSGKQPSVCTYEKSAHRRGLSVCKGHTNQRRSRQRRSCPEDVRVLLDQFLLDAHVCIYAVP
jgi:hypothetical protein